MADGPGKYDAEATLVRNMTEAQTVVVIVIGGSRGSGFSVQTTDANSQSWLPRLLRDVADQIQEESGRGSRPS
jgi:hypothetical protein